MNSGHLRKIAFVLVLAFAAGLAAAQTGNGSVPSSPDRPWVWPLAPETPRVQFLKTVITPQDLGIKKGFFAKIWEFIAGADTVDHIVSPHGVAADGEGRMFVADWGGACVHSFDFEKKKYDRFSATKEGDLVSPIGVALDGEGLLYVSDSVKKKVFVFDGSKNKRVIGGGLLRPTGIAVNRKEKILYVVDTAGHRVDIFDLAGRKLGSFGKQGSQNGEFNYPTHIALDAAGAVYIMDSLNFRVQIFDKAGTFLGKFGGTGTSIHDFVKPKGIAVDGEGHIWVSDSLRNSIQVFDRQGRLLLIFGRLGTGPGEFNIPAGMFIDSKNRLYVADSYNHRVQAFQYLAQEELMKRYAVCTMLFFLITLAATAASALQVLNSKHDLSSGSTASVKSSTAAGGTDQICVFCHTPHNAKSDAPLWNKTSSTAVYLLYNKAFSDVLANLGGGSYPDSEDPSNSASLGYAQHAKTRICLSCHDGTIALGSLVNLPAPLVSNVTMQGPNLTADYRLTSGSASYLGTDLTDDHPVAIQYQSGALAGKDPELILPVTGNVRLYGLDAQGRAVSNATTNGSNGSYVECTSCHNAHDNQYGSFLVGANDGSKLCFNCHKKSLGSIANNAHDNATTVGYNPPTGASAPNPPAFFIS